MAKQKVETENLPTVALQERPRHLATQAQAPRGSEHVTTQDIVIPRLEIIQALSPARKRDDAAYIEGAEEGMIFNTVTRELLGQSVLLVPVLFRKEFLVWKERSKGGGFKGAFQDELTAKQQVATLEDGDDCQVVDTAQHFCLLMRNNSEKLEEVVVSMAKTKLKVSRTWNSLVRLANEDRFARVYALETVPESNAKGSFFNWKITALGYAPEWAYRAGEKLYEAVKLGRIIEADRSDDPTVGEEGKSGI